MKLFFLTTTFTEFSHYSFYLHACLVSCCREIWNFYISKFISVTHATTQTMSNRECLSLETYTDTVTRRCSLKKVLLKISQNWQENSCVRVSFLIKFQHLFTRTPPGDKRVRWSFVFKVISMNPVENSILRKLFTKTGCQFLINRNIWWKLSVLEENLEIFLILFTSKTSCISKDKSIR